ncbi:GNAT family N-acetyltransferase [Streptomyces sp. NPDC101145]|uniref:GNAT family N-acetyltransferase n=1 Tax=Streptomyces sp. NPDC101145 TaxID=3366112 RepID=UPI0038124867
MRADDWHLTGDLDDFLTRAGDFLRSRPALHNTALTDLEKLRAGLTPAQGGTDAPFFGLLETEGGPRAACYRTPRGRLGLTPLSGEQAAALAARLAGLGHLPAQVIADHETATAFAEAWRRRTGAAPVPFWRTHLYRLGTLTPPRPAPEGRGRVAGEGDRGHVVRWCRAFCVDVREQASIDAIDAGSFAGTRFGDKHFTYWESPDGLPVSMAGSTTMVGGMVRVDPVYTPAALRGRGYASAVTAEVSSAALAAGATDVVLYADPANPTSNALYQRLGYVRIADFTGYAFSYDAPMGL